METNRFNSSGQRPTARFCVYTDEQSVTKATLADAVRKRIRNSANSAHKRIIKQYVSQPFTYLLTYSHRLLTATLHFDQKIN